MDVILKIYQGMKHLDEELSNEEEMSLSRKDYIIYLLWQAVKQHVKEEEVETDGSD